MVFPDLFTSISGEKIDTAEKWESFRREEIRALFTEHVYGRAPIGRPIDLSFEVRKNEGYAGRAVVMKEIIISFSGYSFKVLGFVPSVGKKVPAFVYIMHEFEEKNCDLKNDPECEYVPVLDITARGYAVFVMYTSGICPDFDSNSDYREGVYRVLGPAREARRGDDWATISAWGWGASRVMDYLETDGDIDLSHVSVGGHSRGGKTALWCAANDTRFAMAVSNASGCMGASVLRGKTGEHIADINRTDWFCENFRRYNRHEEMLPVDQHMLIALIAPRLVYIESCSRDDWADPLNERLSCREASGVYEKFYGIKGAVLPDEPIEANTAYHDGSIGYHMKTADHCITPYDWKMYMDFWDKKQKEQNI